MERGGQGGGGASARVSCEGRGNNAVMGRSRRPGLVWFGNEVEEETEHGFVQSGRGWERCGR